MARPFERCRSCPSAFVIVAVLLLASCQRSRPAEVTHPQKAPTFNRDVAPILFEHCASCHRPIQEPDGGRLQRAAGAKDPVCFAGAPFPLLEYADARDHGKEIAVAVTKRAMPPWLPEHGFGDFLGERRLSDEQIDLIRQWVDQGAVEGTLADRPQLPKWPSGWQLGQPDLVVTLPAPYTLPAGGSDVFRNFVFPVPLSSTRYVRGMEFRADNPKVLHHASVAVDRTRFSRKLDRADQDPGFAAMPEDEVQSVFGWSPGKVPFLEPADRAWQLEKGSDLVVQLHMLPATTPETIRPTIGLFFGDPAPKRTPLVIKLESKSIDIPAGQADYAIDDTYVLPADVEVLSIYPHAHYLAKEMRGFATLPDGTLEWLLLIKAWDFRWQDQYRYTAPIFLPQGTALKMHFTYDNSERNKNNPRRPPQHVKWGPQSSDEMGALWLEVLPRSSEGATMLTRDYVQRSLSADIAGAEMQVATSPADALAHNYLATRYLRAGRVQEAIAQLNEAIRLKPDDAEAHSNLASALQASGRLAEAVGQAREAVRLKPDDDRVHFNLGNTLNAAGNSDEAILEYRRATQLNPENADAHFNLAMLVGPRNRIDEAIAHLRKTIEINPQYPEAHRTLGTALGLQGRIDEAIAAVREALRIRPDSAEAREQLASLMAARAASRGR
jgi:tetratricopeptide (TPR) repeat protein